MRGHYSDSIIKIGEVIPGLTLVVAAQNGEVLGQGKFGLMLNDSVAKIHDFPFFVFSVIPVPDPTIDMNIEDMDEDECLRSDKWIAHAEEFHNCFLVNPAIGHKIFTLSIEFGFDPQSSISMWLFHKMGVVHSEWRQRNNIYFFKRKNE
jgi:hypothetical protein